MNPRWLTILLLVSVAVNLVFIGVAIGRIAQSSARPFPPHLRWIVRDLEPDIRQALQKDMHEFAERDRHLHKELMRNQRRVNELFIAEPMDVTALKRELASLRDSSMKNQIALHESMLEIMSRLPPEQRREVLNRLQRNWRNEFQPRRRSPAGRREPPRD